jgi:hypothetical protein
MAIFLQAFIFLCLFLYGGSIFFIFFIGDHKIAYVIYSFVLLFLLFFYKKKIFFKKEIFYYKYLSRFNIFCIFVFFINLIFALVFFNWTLLRQSLLMMTFLPLFFMRPMFDAEPILRKFIFIVLFFFFISIFLLLLIEIKLIDYTKWRIYDLEFIPEIAPIYAKDYCCNLDFYNPYYLIYVAKEENGMTPGFLSFQSTRNMLFLTEPTGVATLIVSTVLLAGSIYRRHILPIVSLPLFYLISASNTQIVSILFSLLFLITFSFRYKLLNFLFFLITFVLVIKYFSPFLSILGNALQQFEVLKSEDFGLHSISLFPVSSDDIYNFKSYGVLNVAARFGLIVSFFSYSLYFYMFYFIFLAYKKKKLLKYDFFTFCYVFISSLRIDLFFNPFIYLIFFYYSKKSTINN